MKEQVASPEPSVRDAYAAMDAADRFAETLKARARAARGEEVVEGIARWRAGLRLEREPALAASGRVAWTCTMQLVPPGRGSTEVVWFVLGLVMAALGAGDPLVPLDQADPDGVHHWFWIEAEVS
jgi:hypothetical protein